MRAGMRSETLLVDEGLTVVLIIEGIQLPNNKTH